MHSRIGRGKLHKEGFKKVNKYQIVLEDGSNEILNADIDEENCSQTFESEDDYEASKFMFSLYGEREDFDELVLYRLTKVITK